MEYKIRPHHLLNYMNAMVAVVRGGCNFANVMGKTVNLETGLGEYRGRLRTSAYSLKANHHNLRDKDVQYINDIIGLLTPENIDTFVNNRTSVLRDFINLDQDTPVFIGEAKDDICTRCCAVGNHCKSYERAEENGCVINFQKDVAQLKRMGEIRVADINGVLSITTTAGVIHDVFKGKIRDMGLIRDND